MRSLGKITVVNPGSVGLAHDYRGVACYAVYENGAVRLKRCLYEVERTSGFVACGSVANSSGGRLGQRLGLQGLNGMSRYRLEIESDELDFNRQDETALVGNRRPSVWRKV